MTFTIQGDYYVDWQVHWNLQFMLGVTFPMINNRRACFIALGPLTIARIWQWSIL